MLLGQDITLLVSVSRVYAKTVWVFAIPASFLQTIRL